MSLRKRIGNPLLIGAICLSVFHSLSTAFATDYFYKTYEWSYGGKNWTTTTYVPKELYNKYNTVSVYERTKNGVAGYGFLVTTLDPYVIEVANSLHDAATEQGYNEVSFALSFVQSLRYTPDSVSTSYDEYPRFPVETLVDDGGDCEDTSILFATIALILNYDAVFVNPPDHCAVGIWGEESIDGSYYEYNNRRYYYCETTGSTSGIGDMPSEYEGVSAHIYSINQNSQYRPTQSPTSSPSQDIAPLIGGVIVFVCILAVTISFFRSLVRRKQREATPPISLAPPPPSLFLTSEEKKFCRYCGNENRANVIFCKKCGKRIAKS